jgi:hypothetical protein
MESLDGASHWVAWSQHTQYSFGIPEGWHEDPGWLEGISHELGSVMISGILRDEPGTRWSIVAGSLGWVGLNPRELVTAAAQMDAVRAAKGHATPVQPPRCALVGGEIGVLLHFASRDDKPPAPTWDHHSELWVVHQGVLYVLIYAVSSSTGDAHTICNEHLADFRTVLATWKWTEPDPHPSLSS